MITISHRALFLIAAVTLMFSVELSQLIHIWSIWDGAYSHGILLVIYSGYLIYLSSLSLQPGKPSCLAAFGLLICVAIWVLSRLLFIEVAAQAMWPIMILAVIATLLGWNNMWRLFIPVALLMLAVPIWDYSGYTLQRITVFVDQILLSVTNVVFEVDDIYVHLPGKGTFEVAFGCSGLRYFLIALALSLIIAQQWLQHIKSRMQIIAAGLLLGLASNWLRVAIIIYIGDYTNMQSPLVDDHETFGWILFAIMMLPLLFLGNYLEKRDGQCAPVTRQVTLKTQWAKLDYIAGLVLLILYSVSIWVWFSTQINMVTLDKREFTLEPDGWKKLPIALEERLGIYFNRPDVLWRSSFYRPNGYGVERMEGFIYYFAQQRTGQELVQSGNRFYDAASYKVIEVTDENVGWRLLRLKHRISGKQQWLFTSYLVAGQFTSDLIGVKLSLLEQPFRDNNQVAALGWLLDCGECVKDDELVNNLITTSKDVLSVK